MGVDISFDGCKSPGFKCAYSRFHYFRKIGICATILWLKKQNETLKKENELFILNDVNKNTDNQKHIDRNNTIEQNIKIMDAIKEMMGGPGEPLNSKSIETIVWIKTMYMIPRGISGLCELCCRPDHTGYISVGQSMDILKWYSILSRSLLLDAIELFFAKHAIKRRKDEDGNDVLISTEPKLTSAQRAMLSNEEELPPYEKEPEAGCGSYFNQIIDYLLRFDILKNLLIEAVSANAVLDVY